jgi:hypothetical protein
LHWQSGQDTGLPEPRYTNNQSMLGWGLVIEGCVSAEWQRIQQQHLAAIGSKKGSLRWVTALIIKLWQIAWNMWDHRNQIEHNLCHRLEK